MTRKYEGTLKERMNAASRDWKRRNKEHVKQKLAAWMDKNKERRRASVKAYHENNKDRQREYDYQRYRKPANVSKREADKPKKAEYMRDFHNKNSHILKEANASRRAREIDSSSRQDRMAIKVWYRGVNSRPWNSCFWCKARIKKGKHHFDHIIPLAKDGTHTMDNLCVSCAPCNMSKHDKTLQKWNRELLEPVLL